MEKVCSLFKSPDTMGNIITGHLFSKNLTDRMRYVSIYDTVRYWFFYVITELGE
jgi:hypothetical protein